MLDKSFSKQSLIEYGALSNEDIIIVNCHRGSYNKLGFAYQLIFIRLFNSLPQISPFEIIQEITVYASVQLSDVSTSCYADFCIFSYSSYSTGDK
jgi:hypothetical protein